MDSSIMKFLEEDEHETQHSWADLQAFTAALNRDIEGGNSLSGPSASDGAILSQGNCGTSNQFVQWQSTTSHDRNNMFESLQDIRDMLQKEPSSSEMMLKQHGPDAGNQYQKNSSQDANQPPRTEETFRAMGLQNSGKFPVRILEQNITQNPESQSVNTQTLYQKGLVRCTSSEPTLYLPQIGLHVSLCSLVTHLQAQLDKEKGMQLQTLYLKFRENEFSKDIFLKHLNNLTGDHMVKMAMCKLQSQATRNTETGLNRLPMQSQASEQQRQQIQSNVQMSTNVNNLKVDSRERQADLQGTPESQVSSSGLSAIEQEKEHLPFPVQGHSELQQQHLHFSQASSSTYVNKGNHNHTHSTTNNSSTSAYAKPNNQNLHIGPTCGQTMNMLNAPNIERKNSLGEPRRTVAHMTSNSMTQRSSVQWQSSTNKEQIKVLPSPMMNIKSEPVDNFPEIHISSPSFSVQRGSTVGTSRDLQSSRKGFSTSASGGLPHFHSIPVPAQVDTSTSLHSSKPPVTSPSEPGNNGKTPPKNPSLGQKRPPETFSSLPPSSKKQKASGELLDQSIEQLNDVTAISGVNVMEEEEQLFSGPIGDVRVSEASPRVVQEEERLLLQRIPLQKKLTEIMRKYGLKNRSSDVEQCLSLCVEERMRVLITSLIRFSRQRADIDKFRRGTILTSDIQKQIMVINERAQEEWEKKQAEMRKFQMTNESEGNSAVDGDKEKGEGHVKAVKVNKGEDGKIQATAANVAARAATGGDDLLLKWQLLAEQARQKSEAGELDSESGKDIPRRPVSTLTRNTRDHQEAEKGSLPSAMNTPGTVRKTGRNQVVMPRVARSITIKDVIAVLETEPKMSKSTFVYRLYASTE